MIRLHNIERHMINQVYILCVQQVELGGIPNPALEKDEADDTNRTNIPGVETVSPPNGKENGIVLYIHTPLPLRYDARPYFHSRGAKAVVQASTRHILGT